MGRIVVCLFLVQTFLYELPTTNGQRSMQQYLHLTGFPYTSVQIPAPAAQNPPTSNPAPNAPTINHVATAKQVNPPPPRPATGLPSLSAASLPSLLSRLPQPVAEKPLTKPSDTEKSVTSGIDSKLLNNLAVALQLLIISNILNSPPPDTAEKLKDKIPELRKILHPLQNQYIPNQHQVIPAQNQVIPIQNQIIPIQNQIIPTQSQCAPTQNAFFPAQSELIPNANFLSGSNFGDTNLVQSVKPSRSGISLVSPYEALGTLTSFSDASSAFAPSSHRRDFLSPYAMTEQDVFSMSELF